MLIAATSPSFSQDRTVIACSDYLSVSIGVYAPLRSTDAGETWSVMRDLPNAPVNSIDFSPNYSVDGTIYIAGNQGLFRSLDRGDSWTAIGPVTGAKIVDVAISPNFAADNLMFAITATNQVWRSPNRGNTWTSVSAFAGTVTVIAFNPNYPAEKTLVVGTVANGLFRSNNLGTTWTVYSGAWNRISSIQYSPNYATDRTIWVGTVGQGIFRTTNAGMNWAPSSSGLTDFNVNSIAPSPTYNLDSVVFAASRTGVFVSANSGASWVRAASVSRELSTQTLSHYRSLATGFSQGVKYIYIGMFEGLWRSNNSGAAWTNLNMIPAHLIRKISASAAYQQDETVFATCYGGGALWTMDGGQNWTYHNVGLTNSYPDANAISPNFSVDGKAFLGTGAGMQIYNGNSWGSTRNLGAFTYTRVVATSPDFANDGTVFIGTDNIDTGNPETVIYNGQPIPNQGLFKSVDGGTTWAPTGLGGPRLSGIAVSSNYAIDKTVFASTADSGLYKSTNGGATFAPISVVAGDPVILEVDISPNYAADTTLFAATSHSGIFKSVDGGSSWTLIPGSDLLTGLNMAVSPSFGADHTVYFATMQKGLLKSTDGGATLSPTGLPNAFVMNVVLSSNYLVDQTLFATTYEGIYKSVDGGATWAFTFNPGRMEQDREGNITTSGTWMRTTAPAASTMAVNLTSEAGASTTITFTGSSVTFLGQKDRTWGRR